MKQKHPSTAATGNAALLAVAMALLSLILIIGNAMSRLAVSETQRMLAGESQQELYYIAQAGVQEALGSRFYPRTNIQALMNSNVIPASGPGSVAPDQDPYYRYSGRVTTSELDGTKTVTGINRYIVLGGDPSRDPSTGEFFQTPQDYVALVSHADRISQDFFVISKGSVCLNDDGDVIYNDIGVLNGAVSCNTGDLRHQTLMSEFRVSREDPDNPGETIPNTLVQTVNYEGYNGDITLPMPVQFADGSIRTTFNFETEWFRTDSFAHLEKILVYPTMDPKQNPNWRNLIDIQPGTNQGPTDIKPNEALRLYFRGPINHNSLYDFEPGKCDGWDPGEPSPGVNRAWQCNIRIEQLDTFGNVVMEDGHPKTYTDAAYIPLFPSATQVIVYPPSTEGEGMQPSSRYRLVVDRDLQDTGGRKTGQDYIFEFCVGGCPT